MARAGETTTPAFQRGNSLPYGGAQQANNAAASIDNHPDLTQPPYDPRTELGNQSPVEAFLTSPTDRPNEPATAGVPFGPGPNYTRYAYESDQDFMLRVASSVAADPAATPAVKAFLARVQNGE